jgi:soluble lytic murein transglycosylase-like protein
MRRRGSAVAVFVGLCLAAGPLVATVRLEIRDGRKIILNEPGDARERRLANRFVNPPDAALNPLIEETAKNAGLDPRLVRSVVQVESGYNVRALSNKGAMGLMQLMPETARQYKVENPYDALQNLRAGTGYLRRLIDQFEGRLEHALAGYNAGPGAVDKYRGIPPYRETKDYVRRVLGLYNGRDVTLGNRVVVTRDSRNRILITTTPSGTVH